MRGPGQSAALIQRPWAPTSILSTGTQVDGVAPETVCAEVHGRGPGPRKHSTGGLERLPKDQPRVTW